MYVVRQYDYSRSVNRCTGLDLFDINIEFLRVNTLGTYFKFWSAKQSLAISKMNIGMEVLPKTRIF